ncbi:MAG: LysE family transporter [Coriobacteriia bacterium]|nr:LysE family transporter [Coriobacteriia bacterium]
MSEAASLLARTFVIGILVAAPVGAMGVLCIQRTLAHGWRAGTATGAGIATADGIYAAVAAFGLTTLSGVLVDAQVPLRIAGGLMLVWLGWRAISTPPAHEAAQAPDSASVVRLYGSAIALTLTNPMTVMAFGAVFASAGLVAEPTLAGAGVATLGVILGSLAWWLGLTTTVALLRHAISDRAILWINRGSGVLVAAFGLVAIGAGVTGISG